MAHIQEGKDSMQRAIYIRVTQASGQGAMPGRKQDCQTDGGGGKKEEKPEWQCTAVPPLQSPLGIPDAAAVNESRAGRRRRRCGGAAAEGAFRSGFTPASLSPSHSLRNPRERGRERAANGTQDLIHGGRLDTLGRGIKSDFDFRVARWRTTHLTHR